MEKMLGNKKYILIFILPALLLFLGFTLIPLITSGVYSFFEYNGIGSKTFIGIKNYIEALSLDQEKLIYLGYDKKNSEIVFNFKYEDQVDEVLHSLKKEQPQIKLYSKAGEAKIKEEEEKKNDVII